MPVKIRDRMSYTRAEVIKLQCIECMNYQKGLVNKCSDFSCPLWPYRLGPGRTQIIDIPMRGTK